MKERLSSPAEAQTGPERKSASAQVSCLHCGDPCPPGRIRSAEPGQSFCCDGCETVYKTIRGLGLDDFYHLDNQAGKRPVKNQADWTWMDAPGIRERIVRFSTDEVGIVKWTVPSIHCRSCLWLLEKLPEFVQGIYSARVRLDHRDVEIRFDPREIEISEIAGRMESLGYQPRVKRADLEGEEEPKSLRRAVTSKIGVAGFCAGNIMLLALPEYFGWTAGDSAGLEHPVRLAQLVLILPILFYSASDLFRSAWRALIRGIASVDIPVVIGILALTARSAVALATAEGAGYLDSLAGFVFLLLVGRSFRDRILHRVSFERNYRDFLPAAVRREREGNWEAVLPDDLVAGDQVQIRQGEILPADGRLPRESRLDYHFLTGETEPIRVAAGDTVYAGGRLVSGTAVLEVARPLASTDLAELWASESFSAREEASPDWTDKASRWFTPVVLLVALISAIAWWSAGWASALGVAAAVLIVACPCGLALAAPFSLGQALRMLDRAGLNLRDTSAVENLSSTSSIVLDKTGTMTDPGAYSLSWQGLPLTEQEEWLIGSMVRQSRHPLSQRIAMEHEGNPGRLEVEELEGSGLRSNAAGTQWLLGSLNWLRQNSVKGIPAFREKTTAVHLSRGGVYRGAYVFRSSWRPGVDQLLRQLADEFPITVLSGDNDNDREWLEKTVAGIRSRFQMSPLDKLEWVQGSRNRGRSVLMVGDGLNDAGALAAASTGIAVTGDEEGFFPACDGVIKSGRINLLPEAIKFSKDSRRAMYVAVGVSFLYNLIGLSFAVQGLLTPLIAAILMPLSSITVGLVGVGIVLWKGRDLGADIASCPVPSQP